MWAESVRGWEEERKVKLSSIDEDSGLTLNLAKKDIELYIKIFRDLGF